MLKYKQEDSYLLLHTLKSHDIRVSPENMVHEEVQSGDLLLIDSDKYVLSALENILDSNGRVLSCLDYELAIHILNQRPISLVVMGLNTAEQSVLDAIDFIQEIRGRNRKTTIIVFTGCRHPLILQLFRSFPEVNLISRYETVGVIKRSLLLFYGETRCYSPFIQDLLCDLPEPEMLSYLELQILRLLANGESIGGLAEKLDKKYSAICYLIKKIDFKLGIPSKGERLVMLDLLNSKGSREKSSRSLNTMRHMRF